MKKKRGRTPDMYQKDLTFCFIIFFQFSKEVLQNGQNVPKKNQNSTFFTSGCQNMTLRNKSHEIKKF